MGQPGLCEGSSLSSSKQPAQWWRWPRKWQGGRNHLTLEKQSDSKGFNALPWVWATAIGFDSCVIMWGGRLEVFNGRGLEGGHRDGKKRRGGERAVGIPVSATLDVGPPLTSLISLFSQWFPSTKVTNKAGLRDTILEVTPTLCFSACYTPDILIWCHVHNWSLFFAATAN